MKGVFETRESVEGFIAPIKTLTPIMGDNGIVISFKKENDTIVGRINSINQSVGTVTKAVYKGIFDSFEMDEDSCKLGILRLGEFTKLFSLFDSGKVDFNLDESTKSLTLSQGKTRVVYQTADPDLIKEFDKPFNKNEWYTSFSYNDEVFVKFTKAMSVLSNEECIVVEGDSSSGVVSLTIRNKNVAVNSYTVDVPSTVSENFSVYYKKEIMQTILSDRKETMLVSVGDKLCMIDTKSKVCDMVFYVAKMTK